MTERDQPPKHKYGQYFTPKMVANFMVELADINQQSSILEPSCGEGVFLEILAQKGHKNISAFEIDSNLAKDYPQVRYESFISAKIIKKFDLIIGNPPYIRWRNLEPELKDELSNNVLWKKYFNRLCDYLYIFILKSIECLSDQGQLIFICPEYWMNTTHSISLRNYMTEHGYFEKIYHFNETPIFDKAKVSSVIFKFIKSEKKSTSISVIKYFSNKALSFENLEQLKSEKANIPSIKRFIVKQFKQNERWLLAEEKDIEAINLFEENCCFGNSKSANKYTRIGTVCDIGNGLVSGLDKAFQLDEEQALNKNEQAKKIKVIKAKDLSPFFYKKITPYIFANDINDTVVFEQDFPNFHAQLTPLKTRLEKRYQYKRSILYWHWVFPRNYALFNSDRPRIFVPCKERISSKNYFRFSFVESGIFPTQDVAAIFPKKELKESIYYLLAFLNNPRVFLWLKTKGIIKGSIVEFSKKPIASIPFKKIDWRSQKEVKLHDSISRLCAQHIELKDDSLPIKIQKLFDQLFNLSSE